MKIPRLVCWLLCGTCAAGIAGCRHKLAPPSDAFWARALADSLKRGNVTYSEKIQSQPETTLVIEADPIPAEPLFEFCSLTGGLYRRRLLSAKGCALQWLAGPGGVISGYTGKIMDSPGVLPSREARGILLSEPNWLCGLSYASIMAGQVADVAGNKAREDRYVEDLRCLLAHRDRRVRLWALCGMDVFAIGLEGPAFAAPETKEILVGLLKDPDSSIREVAASYLRRSRTKGALAPVALLLEDVTQERAVRVQAALAFIESHYEEWIARGSGLPHPGAGSDEMLLSRVRAFKRQLGK